jgi:hypothetical protein
VKEIKVVAKSVNSKALYKEVNDTVYGSIETLGVKWTSESHRCSFIEIIEDYLLDLEDENKIEQSKVICDKRNNKTFSSLAKEFVFEVRFQQLGCINTTSLCYHIANRKTYR